MGSARSLSKCGGLQRDAPSLLVVTILRPTLDSERAFSMTVPSGSSVRAASEGFRTFASLESATVPVFHVVPESSL